MPPWSAAAWRRFVIDQALSILKRRQAAALHRRRRHPTKVLAIPCVCSRPDLQSLQNPSARKIGRRCRLAQTPCVAAACLLASPHRSTAAAVESRLRDFKFCEQADVEQANLSIVSSYPDSSCRHIVNKNHFVTRVRITSVVFLFLPFILPANESVLLTLVPCYLGKFGGSMLA